MMEKIKNLDSGHHVTKKVRIIVFAIAFVMLCIADSRNQMAYAKVNEASVLMDEGKYDRALIILEEYKAGHSSLYFWIQDKVNGSSSQYSIGQVENAIATCKKGMKKG